MPAIEHPGRLDDLYRKAVEQQPELRNAIADLGVSADDVVDRVLGDRDAIWRVAAEERAAYTAADRRAMTARTDLERRTPKTPRVLSAAREFGPAFPGCALILYLGSALFIGFATVPKYLALTPDGRVVSISSLIIIVVLMAWNLMFVRQRREAVELLTEGLSIAQLERERDDAIVKVDDALTKRGIEPRMREVLNELVQWKRSETLRVYREGEGLGEVENAELEIATDARARVESLLRQMPGGCIGLAGPRGAGKTTVLSYICSLRVEAPKAGKEVLAVKTSAPVQYDVREFVLHLYSLVCQAVLRRHDADETPPAGEAPPLSPKSATMVRRLASVFLSSALALLLFSVFVASQIVQATKSANAPATTTTTTTTSTATTTAARRPETVLEAFDLKPGNFALVAVALLIAGIALLIAGGANLSSPALETFWRRFRRSGRFETPPPVASPLVAIARDRLEEIRFQHSYASGWAGTLKIPAGVDLQRTSSRTLARQQRTLPEIVDSYVQFMRTLTTEYTVIVGIDELDKMPSTETVHLFLNQAKALFGIPGCFYILSVSENAISAFERRGLPLRDVLDSTFDTIVDVGYLTFAQSQELLKKRVIGLSIPFAALCHALSGGLPRDLIRTCRDLLNLSAASNESRLRELVRMLVAVEVTRKARAISVAVRDLSLDAATDVLDALRRPATEQMLDHQEILGEAAKLETKTAAIIAATVDESDAAERDKLVTLAREATAFLHFAGTMNEVFTTRQVDAWITPPYEDVERLAVARRSFAVRPAVAERAIGAFRGLLTMPELKNLGTTP